MVFLVLFARLSLGRRGHGPLSPGACATRRGPELINHLLSHFPAPPCAVRNSPRFAGRFRAGGGPLGRQGLTRAPASSLRIVGEKFSRGLCHSNSALFPQSLLIFNCALRK